MRRLIEWASILAALGVFSGFVAMGAISSSHEHLAPELRWPFMISTLVFFGSIVACFVLWMLGAWYDRVQLRRERSRWNGRKIHE